MKKNLRLEKLLNILVPFAAGTLLATVFFDLLPEAIELSEHSTKFDVHSILLVTCFSYLAFFILERFLHNFHHHHGLEDSEHKHSRRSAELIVIGDFIHTLADGAVVGLAFLVDTHAGLITLLAILAHKIPQEISDFVILADSKMSTKRAALIIGVIAVSAIPSGIVAYFIGQSVEEYLPILLALTAGFFLYISASDIVPQIHQQARTKYRNIQTLALIFGVILIAIIVNLAHSIVHDH